MGRGQGVRNVLQLTPLANASALEKRVLTLPFTEGGLLELSWDDSTATLQLYDPLPALLDNASIPRSDLPTWLRGMQELVATREGTPCFEHLRFACKFGDTTPRAYCGQIGKPRLFGVIASWDALRAFLESAHISRLF